MRTCGTNGCDRKHHANGGCTEHQTRRLFDVECSVCGKAYQCRRPTGKICSNECRSVAYAGVPKPKRITPLPDDHPVRVLIREGAAQRRSLAAQARRGPLRVAIEAGDHQAILAEVRKRSTIVNDCWIWSRKNKDGYPALRIGRKEHLVHRVSLEASLGKPLGKQAAHHACANTMCVNPRHLQPVTARANTAEMLARTYMESRITDLEAALARLDPTHPLLHEVGVVHAA